MKKGVSEATPFLMHEKKHDKTKYHAYVRSVDCETSSCREGDKGSVNTNAAD
jgi:hypothetical protein